MAKLRDYSISVISKKRGFQKPQRKNKKSLTSYTAEYHWNATWSPSTISGTPCRKVDQDSATSRSIAHEIVYSPPPQNTYKWWARNVKQV